MQFSVKLFIGLFIIFKLHMPKTARIYVTVCEVRTGPLACLSLFAVKSADKVIYFVSEFLNFLVVFRQYISKAHLSTRTPLLIVNIAIILHAIAIMLISMMVPTFIIFASFLYKKGCSAPKDCSEYASCLSNI